MSDFERELRRLREQKAVEERRASELRAEMLRSRPSAEQIRRDVYQKLDGGITPRLVVLGKAVLNTPSIEKSPLIEGGRKYNYEERSVGLALGAVARWSVKQLSETYDLQLHFIARGAAGESQKYFDDLNDRIYPRLVFRMGHIDQRIFYGTKTPGLTIIQSPHYLNGNIAWFDGIETTGPALGIRLDIGGQDLILDRAFRLAAIFGPNIIRPQRSYSSPYPWELRG